MSFTSSSRTLSAEMMSMRSLMRVIASRTSSATRKSSWEVKRAPRIMRSGSSEKESSGVPGVRMTPAARSDSPPCGSTNTRPGRRTAIAPIVKSRRTRSASSVSPNATTGFRESGSYCSAR